MLNVLVGANAGRFQCLRADLFIFVRHKVDAEREVVNTRTFASKIVDSNLGVGHTAVESRLGIWL